MSNGWCATMCDVMMVAGGCHSLLCCGPGSPPLRERFRSLTFWIFILSLAIFNQSHQTFFRAHKLNFPSQIRSWELIAILFYTSHILCQLFFRSPYQQPSSYVYTESLLDLGAVQMEEGTYRLPKYCEDLLPHILECVSKVFIAIKVPKVSFQATLSSRIWSNPFWRARKVTPKNLKYWLHSPAIKDLK